MLQRRQRLDQPPAPLELLLLVGMSLLLLAVSEWFWRVSLRRYTSASS